MCTSQLFKVRFVFSLLAVDFFQPLPLLGNFPVI